MSIKTRTQKILHGNDSSCVYFPDSSFVPASTLCSFTGPFFSETSVQFPCYEIGVELGIYCPFQLYGYINFLFLWIFYISKMPTRIERRFPEACPPPGYRSLCSLITLCWPPLSPETHWAHTGLDKEQRPPGRRKCPCIGCTYSVIENKGRLAMQE